MLSVSQLAKKYHISSKPALDNISFVLHPGRIYGLLGPNGAGKTTLMDIVAGFTPPTSGVVEYNGHALEGSASEKFRAKLGYLPEHPPLYPNFTPVEQLDFVCAAKGLSGDDKKREINRLLELCELESMSARLIKHLSKGFRQRLGIAQAMAANPQVILLDEPAAGLDVEQIVALRRLLVEQKNNRIIILSSHILQEIGALCDHVIIISEGKVAADRSMDEISKGTQTIVTFRGEHEPLVKRISALKGVEICNVKALASSEKQLTIETAVGSDLREKIIAAAGDVTLLEVRHSGRTLESIYMEAIK